MYLNQYYMPENGFVPTFAMCSMRNRENKIRTKSVEDKLDF